MHQPLVIGLFGFGVVGEGIYRVLQQTPTLQASIRRICIQDAAKERAAPPDLFTTSTEDILGDSEINLIVELISDAEAAYRIVTRALTSGRSVVSANKKMIAEHLPELLRLQAAHGVSLLYEGSVCGSVPIIRNLEEYYDNDLLHGLCGIVNGSTNYILTKVQEEGLDYKEALLEAQQAGFAERDPALDVRGIDAVNKLTILLLHAYGIVSHPRELLTQGIDHLHRKDVERARAQGWTIRLVAQACKLQGGGVAAYVLPHYVAPGHLLEDVRNEFNGVVLQSSFSDQQFLYGKGAGRFPTASAVLSDISALRYGYRYEYRKHAGGYAPPLSSAFYLRVHVSFPGWEAVERQEFEVIEEFYSREDRHYLTGLIHFEKLKTGTWWRREGVSLIVLPDGLVEEDALARRQIQRRSLELAGAPPADTVNAALDLAAGG